MNAPGTLERVRMFRTQEREYCLSQAEQFKGAYEKKKERASKVLDNKYMIQEEKKAKNRCKMRKIHKNFAKIINHEN